MIFNVTPLSLSPSMSLSDPVTRENVLFPQRYQQSISQQLPATTYNFTVKVTKVKFCAL